MGAVGVKELKNRLTHYLRRTEQGREDACWRCEMSRDYHKGWSLMFKGGLLAILISSPQFGCSIYKAAIAPAPVPVENVKIGSTRSDVLGTFGIPKSIDTSGNDRIEVYEFVDGHHGASKARILLYIGGDLFTLGLAELVFWPMELAVLKGSEGRAVVTYSKDETVKTIKVTDKNGKAWETSETSE